MDSSFDTYCTNEMQRQIQGGYDVPPSGDTYDYYSWDREARRRWGFVDSSEDQNAFVKRVDRDVEVLAAEISDDKVNGWRQVPHVFQKDRELSAFLSSLELSLRLFFLDTKNNLLSTVIQKFRENFTNLQEKKVIGLQCGKFPEIYLLYELFSLRRMLLNWKTISPENQRTTVKTALSYMSFVKSPEYTALERLLKSVEINPNLSAGNISQIVNCVDQASVSTPYAFPFTCQSVVNLLHPNCPSPSGRLSAILRNPTGEKSSEKSNFTPDHVERRVCDNLPHRMKRLRGEGGEGNEQDGDGKTPPANGKRLCISEYHARYSNPRRYASEHCPFCAPCHIMETLFNGYTRECPCPHKPTEGKVNLHLKRFPEVHAAALRQLGEIKCGITPAPSDDVPIS
uniref:Uncharacterized protein TCIL3000_11_10350 n=1 Tax=Trypanosoma congolense (strain IL3000) TaxID=1068625 RepID=G0V1P2_TRYCI|nr:unnamed protein product [Trypanosoma congolense IL3000]